MTEKKMNENRGKTYARTLNEEHRDNASTTTPQHRRRPRTDAVSIANVPSREDTAEPAAAAADFPATPRPATKFTRYNILALPLHYFSSSGFSSYGVCCMWLDTKYLGVAEIMCNRIVMESRVSDFLSLKTKRRAPIFKL